MNKNTKVIENGNIVLEDRIIWDGTILIENGKIKEVGKNIEIPTDAQIIDACGAYVGPGFFDIHVHGGNGVREEDYIPIVDSTGDDVKVWTVAPELEKLYS